jgi:hypothetical protein
LVSCVGVVRWCSTLVPCVGVVRWCRALVPCVGAVRWCRALVLCILVLCVGVAMSRSHTYALGSHERTAYKTLTDTAAVKEGIYDHFDF